VLATEVRNAEGKVVVSGSARVKVRSERAVLDAGVTPVSPAALPGATAVALVTGASRGLGAEIARVLGNRGIAVAVNYFQSAERADGVVQAIRAGGGHAVALRADVRSANDVRHLVDDVVARFGRLDHLVNVATGELRQERFTDLEWSAFEHHLAYQLKAVVHVCQAAYPALKRAGGSVVNVLSQVTFGAPPGQMADYVAAKHALHGLSKALAAEWAADGIRVNMVSPGLVQTELTQHYQDRVFKMEAARTPLRRLASPGDVARVVAFLLGQESAFLTGINLPVTGGQVMG
jgi:3-oxoacyl-[acyl-carrier protein] reductase